MDWLKSVLPTVATALGGPLAGLAANFVADKMGLDDKTVDGIKQAIVGATPEQMVQMKQIDAELQKYFASLDIRLEEVAAGDRASAREREIKTGDSATPRWLAFVMISGFFIVLAGLLVLGKPKEGGDALLLLLGTLSGSVVTIMAYYFGSTKGSAEKTALLAKSMPAK